MALSAAGHRGGVVAAINVTPLADIMIVLLIIFMVMTPLIDQGAVKLPAAAHGREGKENQRLVISLRADHGVWLGDRPLFGRVALAPEVRARLDRLPETERVVFLEADERLRYTEVQEVMDLCREAGAEQVALLTVRPPGR